MMENLKLNRNTVLSDTFMLHGVVLIWGYSGVLGRFATMPAEQITLFRMIVAFFVLLPWISRGLFKVPRAFAGKFFLIGITVALHWVTFFAAIKAANVTVALACMASTPVFVAFLEPVIFRRALAIEEIATSFIAMVGVGLIYSASSGFEKGIVLALVSSFLAAVFSIFNGKLREEYSQGRGDTEAAMEMTAIQMLGGCLFLGLLQLGWGEPISTWDFSASNIVVGVLLGVFCTALTFTLWIKVMRSVSPFTTCLTNNLEPVYATILALLHFGEDEKMNAQFYLAALLVIGSVGINSAIKNRRDSKKLATEKASIA